MTHSCCESAYILWDMLLNLEWHHCSVSRLVKSDVICRVKCYYFRNIGPLPWHCGALWADVMDSPHDVRRFPSTFHKNVPYLVIHYRSRDGSRLFRALSSDRRHRWPRQVFPNVLQECMIKRNISYSFTNLWLIGSCDSNHVIRHISCNTCTY